MRVDIRKDEPRQDPPFLPPSGKRRLRLLAVAAAAIAVCACGRGSTVDRLGGSVATLLIVEMPPGETTASVHTSLERALADRYVPAEVTALQSGEGFRVVFPPGVDGEAEIAALLEARTRLANAFDLRLAFPTRSRSGLTAVEVAPSMGPGQSDSCTYARDNECDEGLYCPLNTDWSDCAGRRRTSLFVEDVPIVDGRSLEGAGFDGDRYHLTFNVTGREVLNEAAGRNPEGLLAVFLDGSYAGTLRLDEAVTPDGMAVAASGDPWQVELAALATSAIPAPLQLAEVAQIESPDFDGRGSKYPW